MLDLTRFSTLTFDCYGTLVDWEAGILSGLRPLLAHYHIVMDDQTILERYGIYESELEAGTFKPYKEVLRGVVQRFGEDYGFDGTAHKEVLIDTFDLWRPFSDTVEALKTLKKHYRLAILSNVDDDLFAITAKHLQVPFDAVFTAQQIGSYKPALQNFEYAQARLAVTNADHLHVAQSLYHDIAPANRMGISTVWVNRRHDRQESSGATPPAEATPDLEVHDLADLATIRERLTK